MPPHTIHPHLFQREGQRVFEVLKAKACFEHARLVFGVVTWPNGADIDPAWMSEQIRENKLWCVLL